VDTSVAVALVVADHEHHQARVEAVGDRRLGLAGHAAFETFSVLTRLPRRRGARLGWSPACWPRTSPPAGTSPPPRPATFSVLAWLGELHIGGGSVYDALVAAVARQHGLPLVTRDLRAVPTYRALQVDLEILS
jgi:predicted nucleic acid-binding protein